MMAKKLILFPYNGNAIEAIDCLNDEYQLIGFIDDDKTKHGPQDCGYEVFSRDILQSHPDAHVLAVPGSPDSYHKRRNIIENLYLSPERYATVIHPSARVSRLAKIGYNVLIMSGVVITSNASIGNHVCILPQTVIHHDVWVNDFSLIGSNVLIAGHVHIGCNCFIGGGSNLKDHTSIGDNSLIGMGANVLKSIPANVKAAGNPASIIGDLP